MAACSIRQRVSTLIASPDGGAAGGIYRFTRALVVVCRLSVRRFVTAYGCHVRLFVDGGIRS
jgi:hypothetical protein